jgi:hypothetical protein
LLRVWHDPRGFRGKSCLERELAAFVKAANEQLAAEIPDTGIDNLLALSVHGHVVVYAYRAGCLVVFVVLRAMPKLGE